MADEISPISHLEKFIAGQEPAISHLEKIIALYGGSGGSGTTNYNVLLNKPSINGVTLTGNKTLADLGINLSQYTTTNKAVTSIELVDAIPTGSTGTTTEKCLRLTFADSTVTPVDVSVNDLVGSDEKQKAIVCIIDDDGTNRTSDAYTGMTTWLSSKGIPMNFAICHDTIGTSGKYTVSDLQNLQAKGNDILIHGNPKLTTLANETEVINEIEAALQFHTSNGLKPTNIYVYPQGLNSDGNLTTEKVKEIVGRYFNYALNVNIASMSGEDTKGLWNKVPLVDKLNIARMEVTSTKGFDANKSKIDACIENKGLLILFTHSFQSQFTSGGYDEFQKIINYLSTQDVEFLTVSKALEKIEKIVKNYDDTQVKADIAKNKTDISNLDTNKQDKTDNALDTTDKTVVGAINEINDSLLDNITFSADYKNIIINRKGGSNPYTIPIASIIHNAKLIELNDIDTTNIGDGRTLVYDGATKKHKYVDSTGTDELVKMDSTTDAKHLSELIDKSTIVNDNGVLKVKKLDGQQVTIAEINRLKGLTMNVMDLVNAFSNGGVKVLNTPVNTHADLSTLDRSTFLDGISYIVYVLADETHSGAKTTYLCNKTSSTFFGNADSQRNFTTDPIDLANEVTGKLGTTNIDVDALWKLLTINDTYKTLTTKNEVFGTHGAKALYDELATSIGKKANATDLTTHTSDTNIHVTTSDKTKWNEVDNKVDKSSIVTTTINGNSTDAQVPSAKSIYYNCIEGNEINQTTIDTYGTEILKYPLGIWRINSDDLASKFTDLPVKTSGRIEITSIDPNINKNPLDSEWSYRVYNFESYTWGNYIRKITSANAAGVFNCDTGWQRVCTTSVADVDVKNITFTNITNYKPSDNIPMKYSVTNGICYVSGGIYCVSPNNSYLTVCTLPKPKNGWQYCKTFRIDDSRDESSTVMMLINENGELELSMGTATGEYRFTFSYPVSES